MILPLVALVEPSFVVVSAIGAEGGFLLGGLCNGFIGAHVRPVS